MAGFFAVDVRRPHYLPAVRRREAIVMLRHAAAGPMLLSYFSVLFRNMSASVK
jgi:hypothetical protein